MSSIYWVEHEIKLCLAAAKMNLGNQNIKFIFNPTLTCKGGGGFAKCQRLCVLSFVQIEY